MFEFNDYLFTYSEYYDQIFDTQEDWLSDLSAEILEAYNEYTSDKDNKENYQ